MNRLLNLSDSIHHNFVLVVCVICLSFAVSIAENARASATSDDVIERIQFVLRSTDEHSDSVLRITSIDAREQMLVDAITWKGKRIDVTRDVEFEVQPIGIVSIDSTGLVTPLSRGTAEIHATLAGVLVSKLRVIVESDDSEPPVSFSNQIIPVFTKFGCNSGGCHGKIAGQNGFRLSLLGSEPLEDFEHLVKESRGRRLFPAAPDQSLLLTKGINDVPHGGGQRFLKESTEYRLLRRWIAQGMPFGSSDEPKVDRIIVQPEERMMDAQSSQQLRVLAVYSDGRSEDVTQGTQFESNDVDVVEVSASGLVVCKELTGDAAVMARFQGKVDVFRASIPLQEQVAFEFQPRNEIDVAVLDKLATLRIPPSAPCDDATFLRRVTIDIAGRLPTLEEVEAFLADSSLEKRRLLIDRLLNSPEYADHFANKWMTVLRNRRPSQAHQYASFAFHGWIWSSLHENKPYDQFVKELITASGSMETNPAVAWYREVSDATGRVEDVAQLFLGQRIQCARCHHHPFEKWSQEDYVRMTAFYSLVSRKEGRTGEEPIFFSRTGGASASHPKSGVGLKPAGLDGSPVEQAIYEDPRHYLASWMTSDENPFFAKSLVNRYWKHFFGRGIVDPEDDMRITNPPTNPKLLDALAENFIRSGYDLKQLIREICNSQTYQLHSIASDTNLKDRKCFSRYYPKRMTAEVLLDSLDQVMLTTTSFAGMPRGTKAMQLPDAGFQTYFLTVFGRPEASTACECERGQESNLAQSLHLLNSDEIQKKLSDEGGLAAQFASTSSRPISEKVRELYLRALAREPNADESFRSINYIESKSASREAYEDLVWAVVNSKEFLFNH